jgi:hypothetical protein
MEVEFNRVPCLWLMPRTMVGVALLGGARRGELFPFRWRDFDDANRCLHVPPSGVRGDIRQAQNGRQRATHSVVGHSAPAPRGLGGGRWASCDQPTSLGGCVAQDHLRRCTPTRCRSGKDPPWSCPVEPCALDAGLEFFMSRISRTELMFGRADPILRRSVGLSERCVTRLVISREGADSPFPPEVEAHVQR